MTATISCGNENNVLKEPKLYKRCASSLLLFCNNVSMIIIFPSSRHSVTKANMRVCFLSVNRCGHVWINNCRCRKSEQMYRSII